MKRMLVTIMALVAVHSMSAQTLDDTLSLDGSAVVAQKILVNMAMATWYRMQACNIT